MNIPLISVLVVAAAALLFGTPRVRARDTASLPAPSPDVQTLIDVGQTVAAIREYRRQTRASLLEACRVVRHLS